MEESGHLISDWSRSESVRSVSSVGSVMSKHPHHSLATSRNYTVKMINGYVCVPPDLGGLDPRLYVNREPGPRFLLNIALKYSIIENVVSVILFKCILPVSGHVASGQLR